MTVSQTYDNCVSAYCSVRALDWILCVPFTKRFSTSSIAVNSKIAC